VIIPTSTVLSGLVDLAIASLLLVAMMFYYGINPRWGILVWPVAIQPLEMQSGFQSN
jgi:ABC-type polysaccharide/polyol phosphate export permease